MFAMLISLPSWRRLCQEGLGEGGGDAGGKKGAKEEKEGAETAGMSRVCRTERTKGWGGC